MNTTKRDACLEIFPFREGAERPRWGPSKVAKGVGAEASPVLLRPKAGDGLRFVVVNIEHGVELGDLQKVADFLVQVEKL